VVAALTVPYIQRVHDGVSTEKVERALVGTSKEISAASGLQ
jgi:hypothetical protein